MTSKAFSPLMGQITTISFEDALRLLQDLFRQPVSATADFRDTFASCHMQGELTRIETLPPDDAAVSILLDDRQGITLDPIDTEVLHVRPEDGREWWLEFHLPSGVVITIERDFADDG